MATHAQAKRLEGRIFNALNRMALIRYPFQEADAPIEACEIESRMASTGTWYFTVPHPAKAPFIIRFSDHGCAYGGCTVSVDPEGCTATQAIHALREYFRGLKNMSDRE